LLDGVCMAQSMEMDAPPNARASRHSFDHVAAVARGQGRTLESQEDAVL
jgi:hypothetical protein